MVRNETFNRVFNEELCACLCGGEIPELSKLAKNSYQWPKEALSLVPALDYIYLLKRLTKLDSPLVHTHTHTHILYILTPIDSIFLTARARKQICT